MTSTTIPRPHDFVSTTRLLRHVHHLSEGDVGKAINALRALAEEHSNAHNAIRVLKLRAKQKPCFRIEDSGLIRGEERPSRDVGTIIIGDLCFERSGDSMAVYDATMPWPTAAGKSEEAAAIARAALIPL